MTMTLNDKLTALKIPGQLVKIENSGFYTCYYIDFNPDITLNKIKARAADIGFFLNAGIEIETAGGLVILKAAKKDRDGVNIKPFIDDIRRGVNGYKIPLIIGQTENGTRLYFDLCKAPHLLTAGATGSGKSVFMHNCIMSTFYTGYTNIMLIDVKRVEFAMYENLPHLITPVIYDAGAALKALKNLCFEMDRRYETLKRNHCRNISEYRDRGGKLNYIAVFIDELADLLMLNKDIQKYIIRIAQLGRAAGVHLIAATQRPDSNILSGLIRVNIPSRVCFAVQKATDSRIILDAAGGEKLRGAGDGYFRPVGSQTLTRFQAPFISTAELEKIADRARHVND